MTDWGTVSPMTQVDLLVPSGPAATGRLRLRSPNGSLECIGGFGGGVTVALNTVYVACDVGNPLFGPDGAWMLRSAETRDP